MRKVALRPYEIRVVRLFERLYARPARCAVAACEVVTAEKILMPVYKRVNPVFFKNFESILYLIEINGVVFARLRLDALPCYAETDNVDAVFGKTLRKAVGNVRFEVHNSVAVGNSRFTDEIDAVKNALPAVFINESGAFCKNFIHFSTLP